MQSKGGYEQNLPSSNSNSPPNSSNLNKTSPNQIKFTMHDHRTEEFTNSS